MVKNGTARQDTRGNIIRRMRFECWVTKATDTHTENTTLIAFGWLKQLHDSSQCYVYTSYIACLPTFHQELTNGDDICGESSTHFSIRTLCQTQLPFMSQRLMYVLSVLMMKEFVELQMPDF